MPQYDNTNKGIAWINDYKKNEKHPDYKGKGNFNGVDFEIAVWTRTSEKGEFLSISFSEPYKKEVVTDTKSLKDRWTETRANKVPVVGTVNPDGDIELDQPINLDDIPF
jgi:hypothetical protein